MKELEVPPSVPVMAQFLERYKAEIIIEGQKPCSDGCQLPENKLIDKLGIYQNGKLNEPTELLVDPYSFTGFQRPFLKKEKRLSESKM